MTKLLETLAAELERPRELSAQVVKHLQGTYVLELEGIGPFLANDLLKLEDYEHDLIFSPLFTPKLADQTVFAELLGRDSIPQDQWPGLVDQLGARPTQAQLVSSDGQTHSVTLRDVSLERYVHRLRLDGSIPESLFSLLNETPAADRPMLKAIARRAVWDKGNRRSIFAHYLTTALARGVYRLDDAVDLLKHMEDYQPNDVAALAAQIPHFQEVLRQKINSAGGSKPFFSANIKESHGGGRDQRRQDDARVAAATKELEFLDRLQQLLQP